MCEQERKATIQVLENNFSDVIDLEEGMTVADIKEKMGFPDYTATVNGEEAFDWEPLFKYDFITLSPPEEDADDLEVEYKDVEDEDEVEFVDAGEGNVDFDIDVVDDAPVAEVEDVPANAELVDPYWNAETPDEPQPVSEEEKMLDVEEEIRGILNRYSQENASNTPDFILAQYLIDALNAWNKATQEREKWYGRATDDEETEVAYPWPPHPDEK